MHFFFKSEYFIIFLLFLFFAQEIDTFQRCAYCFWPFPSKVGCYNGFLCFVVGITFKEFSMSSSDQSNLDEPSTVFFLFSLSILLSGVATRMDYSISFSFWLLLLLLHCSLTLLGRCGFLGWKIDMEEFVRIKNIKITLSNTWRIMHKHKPFFCNLILSSLCFPLHEVFWA